MDGAKAATMYVCDAVLFEGSEVSGRAIADVFVEAIRWILLRKLAHMVVSCDLRDDARRTDDRICVVCPHRSLNVTCVQPCDMCKEVVVTVYDDFVVCGTRFVEFFHGAQHSELDGFVETK